MLAVQALQAEGDPEHAALARQPGVSSASRRLASATSCPKTTMRASRAISSFSVWLIAATIVSGAPSVRGLASKRDDVGSTSGE